MNAGAKGTGVHSSSLEDIGIIERSFTSFWGFFAQSFPQLTALAAAYYPVPNLTEERVMEGKPIVEITYCVPWGYLPQAAWIATEIFAELGNKVAITITPGDDGILKVTCDGETVYDRHSEDGKYPEFTRMRGIKGAISDYVKAAAA